MSFKALVADDEYLIRRGIISFLNNYEDFEVVAEAEDGEMALEQALKNPVDVYFVDINMPFLNGLEFIQELKKIRPKALVVMITGYDRFDYAREALKLGTFEYLLKPIMEDTFDEMIQRVRKRLEEDMKENKYLEWAQAMLTQSRGHLIDTFLPKVLEGHFTNEEIVERMLYLKLYIPIKFTMVLIQMEYQDSFDVGKRWDDDLLFFAAKNIGNEIFNNRPDTGCCQDAYGNLVIILEEIRIEEGRAKAEKCQLVLENYMPVKVRIVRESGNGHENLPEVYQTAVSRLRELKGVSAAIKEIKAFVEQNYSKKDFSLQEAAEHVNLSCQHLSRIFKKEMGITFIDYVTSVRIRKSIDLFQDEELKIYEIAEQAGYATQHYFSNVFKKHLGVSPGEYRKMIMKK